LIKNDSENVFLNVNSSFNFRWYRY